MLTDRRHPSAKKVFYRLISWLGGIAAVMMLVTSIWTYVSVDNLITSSRDRSLSLLSAGMATSVSDLIVTRDYGALEATLRHSFSNEAIEAIAVTDLSGHVLVSLLRKSDDSVVLNFESSELHIPQSGTVEKIEDADRGYISAWQKIDPGVALGWLHIKVSTKFSDDILAHMKRNMIIFASLLFSVALSIAVYAIYFEVKKINARERALIQSNDELSDAAHHDSLTKLPNRLSLEHLMQNAMAAVRLKGGVLAICFLDLDGFKQVNDQFGHKAGDLVLQSVANRLRRMIRAEDSVLRLGGDEFVLLLGDLLTRNQVEGLLNRIILALQEPIRIGAEQAFVGASIGVTLFPFDNGPVSSLLSHADQAMYQAKLDGKNCWRFFEPSEQPDIPLSRASASA
ncbi:GGDEF domain-containing protein [Polynucleobacter sp. 80A-SIGWE]|nr:GGDEF domain-containing protein [Polynucleobacter sp. 80A-SIGWE]